jgi:hypothetical protein
LTGYALDAARSALGGGDRLERDSLRGPVPPASPASEPERLGRRPGRYDRAMIGFTDWAIEILSKAEEAARRYNPDARIRLVRDGAGVRFDLTDEPERSDVVLDREGFTLFVQHGLEGVIDVVEPHDRLILRSPGDPERSVREHH